MSRRAAFALLGIAALAACGDTPDEAGPNTVSASEEKALREAADAIEQRPIPAEVLAEEMAEDTIEPSDAPPIAEDTNE